MVESLDKIAFNQLLMEDLGQVDLEHLSRSGSVHAPFLLTRGAMAGHCHNLLGF